MTEDTLDSISLELYDTGYSELTNKCYVTRQPHDGSGEMQRTVQLELARRQNKALEVALRKILKVFEHPCYSSLADLPQASLAEIKSIAEKAL